MSSKKNNEDNTELTIDDICNFRPEIIALIDMYADGQEAMAYVKLLLRFENNEKSDVFTILLSELDKTDWENMDMKCIISPHISKKKANRFITTYIRSILPTVTNKEKQYEVSKLGLHIIEDIPFYAGGDQLIWSSGDEDKINVKLNQSEQRLVIDTERYSEYQAITGMIKLIDLCPKAGRVIFAQAILGIARAVFNDAGDAGITPCTVIQVIGKTGKFKTTYSSFLTQLYNRDGDIQPATRLNSSTAAIERILHENRHSTVILDDMHPADSRDIMRKNEHTLEELTRQIGDKSGRGRMEGKRSVKLSNDVAIIVTGEYMYGKGSTAARTLVLDFTEVINSQELHKCQLEPLLVSTFYFYFIKWYVTNYYMIRDALKKSLTEFRNTNFPVIHKRLHDTFFCLCNAYELFLQYCVKQGIIPDDDFQPQSDAFQKMLIPFIQAQDERAKRDGNNKVDSSEYLALISSMYKNDEFRLAKYANNFNDDKHDGFIIHDKYLCLRRNQLSEKINKLRPDTRIDDVINALLEQHALRTNQDKFVIQISAAGNKRFYAIRLKKLK